MSGLTDKPGEFMMTLLSRHFGPTALLIMSVMFMSNANAGISVGGTRLIYNEKNREETLRINNMDADSPWLIQSWVDNNGLKDDQKPDVKPPFLTSPPLFRLNGGTEYELRVLRTGGNLPKDRESIFWLNIKSIPAKPKNNGTQNLLQFAVRTRIKLFFRPAALTGESGEESQKLKFSRQGNQLRVDNPTGYFMTFSQLTLGGQAIDTTDVIVPPRGFAVYNVPKNVQSKAVTWKVINDYGGLSTQQSGNAS